jgi:hypothetical protein
MNPLQAYTSRLADWMSRAEAQEQAHLRMGNWRVLFFVVVLALAALWCRTGLGVGVTLLVLMLGTFFTGMLHDRILNARDTARRAIRFYEAGLSRLHGTWAGKGSPGSEFLDPHHPYSTDLDLFGPGSLFELVNAAQTESGRTVLAGWLLAPADREEIRARQAAVAELRPMLDLRERLALLVSEAKTWIHTKPLIDWASQPRRLHSGPMRAVIFILPFVTVFQYLTGHLIWALAAAAAQYAVAMTYGKRVREVTRSISSVQRDLKWLANVLRCLEREKFQSERLRRMDAACQCEGVAASQAIHRLARLYDWLTSADNIYAVLFCRLLLWETQFAFAIESWRARFGPKVAPWLARLAEMEALSSLAGYAYEHPLDPFPDLLPVSAPAQVAAEGLGHPLIADARCVRNDVLLGPDRRLTIVSGSNMSGKSTYLRAIGVNLVLALAGAPVRARNFRITPLRIGASIRTVDSLQEGTSRFYAEIKRIGSIVKMAGEGTTLVFLLDEILGGTNSHDRRIGAGCIARSLVQRGALGLMTTHDLALTRIAEEIQPPGANFHFEDQLENGRMSFDYTLRPGIVEKSNALELMRSVGLDVGD